MLFTNPRQQGTRFKGMLSESNQELQTAVSENNLELVERLLQRDDIKHNQGNKFNALYRAANVSVLSPYKNFKDIYVRFKNS